MGLCVPSGTSTRRKRNATVAKMGGAMADDPARVKKCSSRKYEASSDSKRWCCMVLGICGLACDCPDQQGAAALFQHAGAADVVPGRAWDAARKAMRKGVKLAAPKARCQYRGFKGRIGRGKRKNARAPPRRRYMRKRCGRTLSGTPGFKGRHYSSKVISRAL